MPTAITTVRGTEAPRGVRGEAEHVRTDEYSLNLWNLRGMSRGETHSNDFSIAIFVSAGVLSVYDADGTEHQVGAGDSVLIPAGTDYSMSAELADALETRIHHAQPAA